MATANPGSRGSHDDGLTPPPGSIVRALIGTVAILALGVVTSFGLFWIMQALISTPYQLGESTKKLAIEFVRLRKDTTPETKEREKPKREKPEQQPPPPEMNVAKNINPGEAVGEIIPMMDTGAQLAESTSLAAASADSSPVPIVQIDPDYPERAKQQRIEGWVDIQFTISAVGTVVDAVVVKSKPAQIFDRAAIEAVRRWKYNPMTREGVPVARPGMYTRIEFKLPKRSR